MAERSKASDCGKRALRYWIQSPSTPACNFSTPDCKKINKATSVRVIRICGDHRIPKRDIYKSIDGALAMD